MKQLMHMIALTAISLISAIFIPCDKVMGDPPDSPHGDLDEACSNCHGTSGWRPAQLSKEWSHDSYGFRLEEGHGDTPCMSCHTNLKFESVGNSCIDCHQDIHFGEMGSDCSQCHNTRRFDDRSFFRHLHEVTRFPLEGAHQTTECDACHTGSSGGEMEFVGTPRECEVCHAADAADTDDPDHVSAGYLSDCEACHSPSGWSDALVDHSFFPLTLGHGGIGCADCHGDAPYAETSAECISCHAGDFESTIDPDHTASGFPPTCLECHTTAGWEGAELDHSHFALEKGHGGLLCVDCHDGGVFSDTESGCEACHIEEYRSSRSLNHSDAGFSTNCEDCHETESWSSAEFDHSHFELAAGHGGLDCMACHESGPYDALLSDCYGCHRSTYDGTRQPDHVASGIPTDCNDCHTIDEWGDGAFVHDFFSLTGGHMSVDCISCHVDGDFQGTYSECATCHLDDYAGVVSPQHSDAGFSTDCASCHTVDGWGGIVYDHSFFELVQGHGGLDCMECHTGGLYSETSSACFSCHEDAYYGAENPDHKAAAIPDDCSQCHDIGSFGDGTFDHTYYELTGNHASADCNGCHGNGVFQGTPSDCAGCHLDDYQGTTDPAHGDAGFSTDCVSCHTTDSWMGGELDHSFFALTEGHGALDCAQCHTGGPFSETESDCAACHEDDYTETTAPDHQSAGIPTDCDACHDPGGWGDGTFDHGFFVLTGGHGEVDCNACHVGGDFQSVHSECATCHLDDYAGAPDPNHSDAGFSTDCESCHDIDGWSGIVYDHSFFALTQGHGGLDCSQCHTGGPYSDQTAECIACHESDFFATTEPDHKDAGISEDCAQCHDTGSWGDGTFNHNFFTLTGGHSGVDCISCHVGGDFLGLHGDCATCHLDDYAGSAEPNHSDAGFDTDCEECHTVNTWVGVSYDHSHFTLSLGHGGLDCSQCHTGGPYNEQSSACVDCHEDDFLSTTEPDHEAANIPRECKQCHDTAQWTDGDFDHGFFVLSQGHGGLNCSDCHGSGVFQGLPNQCEDCHLEEFVGTSGPNHGDAGFPTDCADCHDIGEWGEGNFDHGFFALTQAHGGLDCAQCHGDGVYAGRSPDCEACHMDDYQASTAPDHSTAGFPTDCAQCHDLSTWGDGSFDHGFYPLTESHGLVDCSQCHVGGIFQGTGNTCDACHLDDYQATNAPDHVDAGFSTDCAECHDTGAWGDGSFDHGFFPLNQGHGGLDCTQCHINGDYQGTSAGCVSCHLDDYNGTNSPDHGQSGFGTNCIDCHDRSDWNNATFDHDGTYFPIYTGKHREAWNDCSDCHVNQSNYSDFSCVDCHKHSDRNDVDDDHDEVDGYLYESWKCLQCHPDGDN